MNTAPAAVTALLPPAVPSGPDLDLTPLLGTDPMTAVVVVLIAGVVVAAAHAAIVLYRKGRR